MPAADEPNDVSSYVGTKPKRKFGAAIVAVEKLRHCHARQWRDRTCRRVDTEATQPRAKHIDIQYAKPAREIKRTGADVAMLALAVALPLVALPALWLPATDASPLREVRSRLLVIAALLFMVV